MLKRLLALLFALCLCLTAAAEEDEGGLNWDDLEDAALADLAGRVEGWQVAQSDTSGYGSYKGKLAVHTSVLLCRAADGLLQMKEAETLLNAAAEGEPFVWEEALFAPVPLSPEAAEALETLSPGELILGETWCWFAFLDGLADFMLREGEHWAALYAGVDHLVGVAQDAEGRQGLRAALWDGAAFGPVIASPMWERNFSVNKIHSGGGELEIQTDDLSEGLVYVDLYEDGQWRWSGVNNGYAIYILTDDAVVDSTWWMYDTNDVWHYGRLTLPRELEVFDLDQVPFRGPELVRLLDSEGWACVRADDTPMYAAPDGDVIASCYARAAGRVAGEEGEWVCLQLGSAERGLQGWFRREALAFGPETEEVRCGFPVIETSGAFDPFGTETTDAALAALEGMYEPTEADEDWIWIWIIGRSPDGRFLLELDQDLVAFTRPDAALKTCPQEEYEMPLDFSMTDEEWAAEFSWEDDYEDEEE